MREVAALERVLIFSGSVDEIRMQDEQKSLCFWSIPCYADFCGIPSQKTVVNSRCLDNRDRTCIFLLIFHLEFCLELEFFARSILRKNHGANISARISAKNPLLNHAFLKGISHQNVEERENSFLW